MRYGIKLLAGLVVPAVLLAAGCGEESGKNIKVAFISLTADGSGTNTTTKLTLEFDRDIANLEAADIVFDRKTTGAVPNILTKAAGQTGVYELTVSKIKAGGKVTVLSIEKSGYTITGAPKDVTVHYSIGAFIDAHWEEYGYSSRPNKYIALSFDDGPSAVTQSLLNALETKKVKATFFLIGGNVRSRKSAAKAIFDAGHELANHSDGYDSLGSTAEAGITASLTAASAAIKEITGADPALFRAPNVNYGANLTKVCTDMGLAIIGVSVWSNDWQSISSEQIITNVVDNTFLNSGDGGIINCHELANTVAAVSDMVDGLREKGFWIMTVGELAIVKGKTLQAGTQYDSIR